MNALLLALVIVQTKQARVSYTAIRAPLFLTSQAENRFYSIQQIREGKGGGVRSVISISFINEPAKNLTGNATKILEDTSKHTVLVYGRVQQQAEAGKRTHGVKLLFRNIGRSDCTVTTWIDGRLLVQELVTAQ